MSHRILIIDDDKTTTTLVKYGLSSQRYSVDVAHNGAEALEHLNETIPDLIVLDVHMPQMDGYEFMGELKRLHRSKQLPVIMLTANENMEDLFRMEGVVGYLIKPIDIDPLIAEIKKCLGENPV